MSEDQPPDAPGGAEADAAVDNGSEAAAAAEHDSAEPIVFPLPRKRRGGMLGAAMLGLEQALYGPRENEIVMVADADGMPEPDFDVQLTADPRDSYVVMKKHWWSRHRH